MDNGARPAVGWEPIQEDPDPPSNVYWLPDPLNLRGSTAQGLRYYVTPIALEALAISFSVDAQIISCSAHFVAFPMFAAATVSKTIGGVHAARLASLIGGPLAVWFTIYKPVWYLIPLYIISFVALCFDTPNNGRRHYAHHGRGLLAPLVKKAATHWNQHRRGLGGLALRYRW